MVRVAFARDERRELRLAPRSWRLPARRSAAGLPPPRPVRVGTSIPLLVRELVRLSQVGACC